MGCGVCLSAVWPSRGRGVYDFVVCKGTGREGGNVVMTAQHVAEGQAWARLKDRDVLPRATRRGPRREGRLGLGLDEKGRK